MVVDIKILFAEIVLEMFSKIFKLKVNPSHNFKYKNIFYTQNENLLFVIPNMLKTIGGPFNANNLVSSLDCV